MGKTNLESKIVTVMLLAVIIVGSIWSEAYLYADEWIQTVIETTTSKEEAVSAEQKKQQEFIDEMPFKQMMIDLNGTMAQMLKLRELYKNSGGVVLRNGYVARIYEITTTDYEIQQIVDLKAFLDEKGITLLYVNEPTKYFDDTVIEWDMGRRTYINANADILLERMSEAGVNYIDLREIYTELGYDSFDQVTVSFLSLGVSEVQTLVLRNYEGSLREYIDEHDIVRLLLHMCQL